MLGYQKKELDYSYYVMIDEILTENNDNNFISFKHIISRKIAPNKHNTK